MSGSHSIALAASLALAVVASGQGPNPLSDAHAPDHHGRLGGETTVHDASPNAFSMPAPILTHAERRAFAVGNSFFKQNWISAPGSAAGRDGLGPMFNARSCSACHFRDGRSRPPAVEELERHGLLMRIGVRSGDGADRAHPVYGAQIQDEAVLGVEPEAKVDIAYRERVGVFGDGTPFQLLEPHYELRELAYGELGPDVVLGPRTAPALIGLGLLEAIPHARLESLSDPHDADGDGISGRVHRLDDGVGRFGWKATKVDVRAQSAAAFANDMGITSSVVPHEVVTATQRASFEFASGGSPEIADHAFERVVFYTRTLAVPAQRSLDDPAVQRGRTLFEDFGCAACHVPSHVTEPVDWHPRFGGQEIWPYTDLLLHDMGDGLADGKHDGDAAPSEWRTPPLWGIGLVPVVNGHSRYLHDGRARDLCEAILWHGGEGLPSRERFRLAEAEEREALLAFLRSL